MKIALGVLLTLIILLIAPLRLHLSCCGGVTRVAARYLFLRFWLFRSDKEKKRKDKPRVRHKPKKKAKKPDKPPKEKKDLSAAAGRIRGLMHISQRSARLICRHVVIYKMRADIRVAGGDAYKTALDYVKISSLLIAAVRLLDLAFVLKKPDIKVSPDFLRDTSLYNVSLRLRLRPVYIAAALALLLPALCGAPVNKQPERISKSKQKGGHAV